MAMECRECRSRLEDYLIGNLSAELAEATGNHLADCEDCRELLAARAPQPRELDPQESLDLTENILARTSGSACERAHEMIGNETDAPLCELDAELLRAHLDHCDDCEALAEAVAWSGALLPAMAALEPDPAFLRDVLRATSERESEATLPPLLERLGEWWQRLWRRPRFSLEVAYVGTLLLILLFALPFSPARNAPNRALHTIGEGREILNASLAPNLGALHEGLVRQGSRIRSWSDDQLMPELRKIGIEIDERGRLVSAAATELRRDSGIVIDAALHRELGDSVAGLSAIGGDLAKIWRSILGLDPAPREPEMETPTKTAATGVQDLSPGSRNSENNRRRVS
jgi:hypothetical protein